jgi:GT2 family glycosyltransferase
MSNPKRIDDVGGYIDAFGFVYGICHHGELDVGQYDKMIDVFRYGITALIVRKKIFQYVGGFDSRFFMWYEDNDLCWRIHLAGFRIVSVPKSIIYHNVSGTVGKVSGALSQYYNERNRIATLTKNYSISSLFKFTFLIAFLEGIQVPMFVSLGKPDYAVSSIKAYGWVIINFTNIWKRHIAVQAIRKVSDREIMRKFVKLSVLTKFSSIVQKRT